MHTTYTKNLLSGFIIGVFFLLATASHVSKVHCETFEKYDVRKEMNTENGYLIKNTGTRVYGKKIHWKKDRISIDKQEFALSDIKAYVANEVYYARHGSEFMERIIEGKINIYRLTKYVTHTDANTGHSSSLLSCTHYYQKGEDGEIINFYNIKTMKKAVADCPEAYTLMDMKDNELTKNINAANRQGKNYLRNVFEVYNQKCK